MEKEVNSKSSKYTLQLYMLFNFTKLQAFIEIVDRQRAAYPAPHSGIEQPQNQNIYRKEGTETQPMCYGSQFD